ncbi:RNA polymerase subunit sigma-70 [Caenimonas sedimenti]|uniref:RNA polymerase subunit sigma-70 n=1 Tax=Caenimonas sedimenti TaxID=2596921 RepID=A0A562ZWJ7_9BURK|nr:anti-sigma factor [Caenimonas sedimenti]TWO72970.1 RNA polymerase subunit sigma-70 [Caenimonas sedimenti]
MNLLSRPDLIDRLAAAYALGTLRGGARRRFEELARRSPAVRVQVQVWQERFMSITELQHAQAPDANVWKRIENVIAAEGRPAAAPAAAPASPAETLLRALGLWRLGAVVGAVATVAAVAVALNLRGDLQGTQTELAQLQQQGRMLAQQNATLTAQLAAQPDIRYVSVLHDDKATPTMLVTYDPKHNTLTLKRVGSYQEAGDKSLQLWAIPAAGAPRSLGVMGADAVAKLAAAEQVVGQSPLLAVSLEPKGGVPGEGGPTGPVIFKGAVLQTPL